MCTKCAPAKGRSEMLRAAFDELRRVIAEQHPDVEMLEIPGDRWGRPSMVLLRVKRRNPRRPGRCPSCSEVMLKAVDAETGEDVEFCPGHHACAIEMYKVLSPPPCPPRADRPAARPPVRREMAYA